jgi:hypothetical protein
MTTELAMKVIQTDVISLFDFSFEPLRHTGNRGILLTEPECQIQKNLSESFGWMFYGWRLPHSNRRTFSSLTFTLPNERGASLLVHDNLNLGVCCIWQKLGSSEDPLQAKHAAWHWYEQSGAYASALEQLGYKLRSSERLYTFMSLIADVESGELTAFCRDNAEQLGRIFTGNYENEERAVLEGYLTQNLSRRVYERLFLRWTDALALYSRDAPDYEYVLFRAVQVYEACIFTRSILQAAKERASTAEGQSSIDSVLEC